MREYIILNGKSSRDITGLLIQSLPPVTKPKKRVEIEEIEGRDGDIVNELGYSAYDKEIKIGLSWNYDVDEIIEYFDSKGIIVLSNEPDKYYKYEIYEQIDFEKLLRFKEATVKIHVQPFKYSLIEHKEIYSITNETEINIRNNGNTYARPIMRIKGSGTIYLYLNSLLALTINMTNDTDIMIDLEKANAYNETTGYLKNRLVTGNYDKFKLKVGKNTVSWNSGTITEISFENYSRWI